MLIQQGDVLFHSVSRMPKGKRVERSQKYRGYVLAEGEVTGHAHVIADDIDLMLDEAGKMFMHNDDTVTIKHEEHKAVKIPAGNWEVGRVKEYDHFEEEAKQVRD